MFVNMNMIKQEVSNCIFTKCFGALLHYMIQNTVCAVSLNE